MSLRLVTVSALALLIVAGCQRREEAAETDVAVTAATDQDAPLTYETTTSYATVELELPASVRAIPDLRATLYGEGVADLRRFTEGAQADQSEYTGEEGPLNPYNRDIEWSDAGQTPRLYSLSQVASEYTGGAHPNSTFGALLWDRQSARRLQPAALFAEGADMVALDRALCQAVNAARRARTGEPSALTQGSATDWSCPQAMLTPFVLEPSTEAGRAGGLVFLINPYVVGPYAEGSYEVVVPQAAFRALLAPAYAGEFAGSPVRTGDVTPQAPVYPERQEQWPRNRVTE